MSKSFEGVIVCLPLRDSEKLKFGFRHFPSCQDGAVEALVPWTSTVVCETSDLGYDSCQVVKQRVVSPKRGWRSLDSYNLARDLDFRPS